jgi:hypothetical protein
MQVKELKELFEDDATFYKNTNNFRHYLPWWYMRFGLPWWRYAETNPMNSKELSQTYSILYKDHDNKGHLSPLKSNQNRIEFFNTIDELLLDLWYSLESIIKLMDKERKIFKEKAYHKEWMDTVIKEGLYLPTLQIKKDLYLTMRKLWYSHSDICV